MYCPRCGQKKINENTNFCTRCRFLMTGFDEVVRNGGLPKEIVEKKDPNAVSPRRRGIRQGVFLFLSGIVIVPLIAVFVESLHGDEAIIGIAAILTFLAGIVRTIYALFQSGTPTLENEGLIQTFRSDLVGKKINENALPPRQREPIMSDFTQPKAGNWRETADLFENNVKEENTRTFNQKTMP